MSVSRSRSVLANATKRALRHSLDPATEPQVIAARQQLAEANLEAHIRRVVAAAPPLSEDQIARLQALFSRPPSEKSTNEATVRRS